MQSSINRCYIFEVLTCFMIYEHKKKKKKKPAVMKIRKKIRKLKTIIDPLRKIIKRLMMRTVMG